jgi:adenylylsulfate kinase
VNGLLAYLKAIEVLNPPREIAGAGI